MIVHGMTMERGKISCHRRRSRRSVTLRNRMRRASRDGSLGRAVGISSVVTIMVIGIYVACALDETLFGGGPVGVLAGVVRVLVAIIFSVP